MSGFSVTWLDLREGADFAARDKTLAARALQWMSAYADAIPLIVDLGSGTGSTLRALTALGAEDCAKNLVWRLVDHDPALLNEALRRHGKTHVIEDYEADLLAIDSLPLTGARLVSASALFDLVSRNVVDKLAARLAQQGTALYAALNYDGCTQWNPPHPLDSDVLEAFNKDQRRDKGLGMALGTDSGSYLKAAFEKQGYEVQMADSPWTLGTENRAMVEALIDGIASAVATGYGLNPEALHHWKQFRLQNAATGTCIVGHNDILALPLS
ncbi:MAG: class I SAM-dependent methyltransferase [Gammaproteobacteria bacterium]|nr:class I SAM-dependent methyltransferase [Gammaproteobacteria bacterium]MDP2139792.1 class I SAM-dependent methyltransferase [Gammaproteobacteria bacterium]MDP2346391.1 class I SAM-dependent methyltransferase [Gammaproteobacteria bacterium]